MPGKVKVAVFLAILLMLMAGVTRAELVLPLQVGYNATYSGSVSTPTPTPFTSTLQITGTTNFDSLTWYVGQFTNWIGPDRGTNQLDIYATETAVYIYDPSRTSANDPAAPQFPHFQIGNPGYSWTDDNNQTRKITQIIDSYTTPAGTFNNVYEVQQTWMGGDNNQTEFTEYEYWKPGVGFLGQSNDKYYDESTNNYYPESMSLAAYSVPVPPSLLLLGSGLVGLLGMRRFRQS